MNFRSWALRWGVPMAAVVDWETECGLFGTSIATDVESEGKSESWAQSAVRLEAAQKGLQLWRNNVGALPDESGRVVRYGLANESAGVNAKIKSGDLIGIRPMLIEPRHVGWIFGQFVSREIKPPGWVFTGKGREAAQQAFANLVIAKGGDAGFATGPGSL